MNKLTEKGRKSKKASPFTPINGPIHPAISVGDKQKKRQNLALHFRALHSLPIFI